MLDLSAPLQVRHLSRLVAHGCLPAAAYGCREHSRSYQAGPGRRSLSLPQRVLCDLTEHDHRAAHLVKLTLSLTAPPRCCPPRREWPAGPLLSAPPSAPATQTSAGRKWAATVGEEGESVEAAHVVGTTGDRQQDAAKHAEVRCAGMILDGCSAAATAHQLMVLLNARALVVGPLCNFSAAPVKPCQSAAVPAAGRTAF